MKSYMVSLSCFAIALAMRHDPCLTSSKWLHGPIVRKKEPHLHLGRRTSSTFQRVDGFATYPTLTLVVSGGMHGFAIACQGTYTRDAMAQVPHPNI